MYEDFVEGSVFSAAHKLTRSRLELTVFNQMKVNLAAHVLSSTVADCLEEKYGDEVGETVKFTKRSQDSE